MQTRKVMKRTVLLCGLAVGSVLGACSSSSSTSGSDPEAVGEASSALSKGNVNAWVGLGGKCLDDNGDRTADGTKVQLYTCNGTTAQRWTLTGGQLIGPGGKCLDVTGNVSTSGTPVELWTCWGGPNQQWTYTNGQLVGIGGKCLDVRNGVSANGTQVQIYDCNGTAAQQWEGGTSNATDAGAPKPDASAPPDAGKTGDGGAPPTATGLVYGANLHAGDDYGDGDPATVATQFGLMKARNLKAARIGGPPDSSSNEATNAWLAASATTDTHLSFMLDIAWEVCPTDGNTFASNDTNTIYATAYQAVESFVAQYRDSITDWEMGNEIDLRSGQSSSPGLWNTGWAASDWDNVSAFGSSDYYANWAAAIKGTSDAIAQVNATYGTHLRRILNTTSTHTGFLDYMAAKGVGYDVISYHYYYAQGTSPYALSASQPGSNKDSWDLFAGLGAYAKPVTINEMNCAEIYQDGYNDQASDALYATCLSNLRDQIAYIRDQKEMNLESLYVYELLDEPQQSQPENHFGLFWNDGNGGYTPKANLLLWSAFAGGALSSGEQATLSSFGLLPLP